MSLIEKGVKIFCVLRAQVTTGDNLTSYGFFDEFAGLGSPICLLLAAFGEEGVNARIDVEGAAIAFLARFAPIAPAERFQLLAKKAHLVRMNVPEHLPGALNVARFNLSDAS